MNKLDPYSDTNDTCADYVQRTLSFCLIHSTIRVRDIIILFCLCVRFLCTFIVYYFKAIEIIDMCSTNRVAFACCVRKTSF